jgi:voltage-gated sodium channel
MKLQNKIIQIRESKLFEILTTSIIIFYALVLGLKTMKSFEHTNLELLMLILDYFVTIYFLIEIIIKISAEKNYLDFFKNGWNIFDFLIVVITIIPLENTDFAAVARLFRIFRVLRLITARPQLKRLISILISSIPAIFDILLLMFIVFYIYSVVGSFLFYDVNPALWGDFLSSMLTLFKVLTLEGWSDIMDAVMLKHPWSWVYFVSFIIMTSFILFNLFIAVIISKMQKEHEDKEDEKIDLILEKVIALEKRLEKREKEK